MRERLAKTSELGALPHYRIRWKDDVVGDVFVDGDVVFTRFGERVMYDCPVGDTITFYLPATTPGDAGKRVAFGNIGDGTKSVGTVNIKTGGPDNVEGFGVAQAVQLQPGLGAPTFELEFVGDARWILVCPIPGPITYFQLPPP